MTSIGKDRVQWYQVDSKKGRTLKIDTQGARNRRLIYQNPSNRAHTSNYKTNINYLKFETLGGDLYNKIYTRRPYGYGFQNMLMGNNYQN